MFEIFKLARRRLRSSDDYRKMQTYIAERAVSEIEARGIDFSRCDVLETAAGGGGYSRVLAPRAKSFLANDARDDPFYEENGIPFAAFDLTEPFPLSSDAYDLIYSSSVIEHLTRRDVYLRECRRVLRPDGVLYLSFPPFYSLAMIGGHGFKPFHFFGERFAITMHHWRYGSKTKSHPMTWGDFGLYPLTISEVSKMITDNGFQIFDTYTRMCPVNTAKLPGLLKDLATWHVCFLARPMA